MSDAVERLRSIKTFPQLVKYLRDELDWPIESDDVEDLTFEYEAEELGIHAEHAVKIKEIKQLRPLDSKQPWGIFWINFEKKRLPMVVLRRILGNLVVKKRASAKKGDRPRWHLNDLLFISSYGEEEHRTISFAHFAEDPDVDELPVLRVLGWDDQNSIMHLDRVANRLQSNLRWPDENTSLQTWRQTWSDGFTDRYQEAIRSANELIPHLAMLARGIRKRVEDTLKAESERGPMRKLLAAVRGLLIHDMDEKSFADMYAQTVAYGLLSARFSRPAGLTAQNLVQLTAVSNPFLENLLESLFRLNRGKFHFDVDEIGINDVLDLLRRTNIEAIKAAFNDDNPAEDPVILFYQDFLQEYDPKQRVQRGIFFTPRPVVSYIVRSVHELLQTEFGLEDGLASTATWTSLLKKFPDLQLPEGVKPDDPFVCILDPATGTGTFLFTCIEVIERTKKDKWCRELGKKNWSDPEILKRWREYVPKYLLPRLYGYELMMAPYAIAHLKLALKLAETGYQFRDVDRLHIYLTNSLEPPSEHADPKLANLFATLASEAQEVNRVKRFKRFTVIIGNPPYSNFGQLNRNPFILGLLEDYKRSLDEKKLNLDDDYIKFVRLAHWLVDATRAGIVGMITNNSFLDGLSHRRMRESLRQSFGKLSALDLGGSVMRGEVSGGDENVFDIQQGVAISIFRTSETALDLGIVEAGRLTGLRETKYRKLLNKDAHLVPIASTAPYHFFVAKKHDQDDPYLAFLSYKEMFEVFGPGIKAERDAVAIHSERGAIEAVVRDFQRMSEREIRTKYGLHKDSRDWTVPKAKADTIANAKTAVFTLLQYRPFDYQWTWYSGKSRGFIGTPGSRVAWQMLKRKNVGLITNRQIVSEEFTHVFVSNLPISHGTFYLGNKGQDYLAPLYLTGSDDDSQPGLTLAESGRLNFTNAFLERVSSALRLKRSKSSLPSGLTPEDLFHYAYAVFHSPGYRSRYAEFLKIDFPRLPLTGNLELFRVLARLGGELTALHLLESPKLKRTITKYIGGRNPEVEKVSWSKNTVWVDKAQTTGFKGVREDVWNFHIGGYQVCEKWLKDRKGRKLTKADIEHYQKIVVALNETIRLMAEIDKVIEKHGGWPGAFATAPLPKSEAESDLPMAAEPSASYGKADA